MRPLYKAVRHAAKNGKSLFVFLREYVIICIENGKTNMEDHIVKQFY